MCNQPRTDHTLLRLPQTYRWIASAARTQQYTRRLQELDLALALAALSANSVPRANPTTTEHNRAPTPRVCAGCIRVQPPIFQNRGIDRFIMRLPAAIHYGDLAQNLPPSLGEMSRRYRVHRSPEKRKF
jgi:hypothetical protein